MTSAVSAETFCVLCYWAHKSGMPGLVSEYGKAPGGQSGHYSRHLQAKLGFDIASGNHYVLRAPGYDRLTAARDEVDVPLQLPHEQVQAEVEAKPDIGPKLERMIANRELPPCYYTHPTVEGANRPVLPISVYMDAVPYSDSDSVVGIWVTNLVTQARHIAAVVRKRLVRRCGCRGTHGSAFCCSSGGPSWPWPR
eukprot:11526298-Alexandrium_andersonii.AAC.1